MVRWTDILLSLFASGNLLILGMMQEAVGPVQDPGCATKRLRNKQSFRQSHGNRGIRKDGFVGAGLPVNRKDR